MLEAKMRGAIRGAVSNSPQLSQALVEKALSAPSIDAERKEKPELLRARAAKVYEVARAPRSRELRRVPLQQRLLHVREGEGRRRGEAARPPARQHGTGLISTAPTDIRVAFSCLEVDAGRAALRDAAPGHPGAALHLTIRAQAGSVARRLPERC